MKILLFTFMFCCSIGGNAQKTGIIIYNAKVITLDDKGPGAESIAIRGNRILKIGTDDEVLKYKSPATRLINAKGRSVIPGLFDSHLHVIRAGRFYNAELRWDGVKTLKRALQMLKEQASRTPKGQWVRVVGGWSEYQFAEKRLPTLDEINEATGDVPAFVLYLYGEAYLNKPALSALNITADTPNPPGGLIQKDKGGNPTGLLVAEPNAFLLYSTLSKLPELTQAERINSTKLFMSELNRLGVTSVMDAGGGFQNFPGDYGITDSLGKLGELTIRLPFYLFAQKPGRELADFQIWIRTVDIDHYEENITEYLVKGGGENLVASAGDFENFLKPRPELPLQMEQQLREVIRLLVTNRWPFRLHATYNESITRFLNVIESINVEIPLRGLPWFFDHAETVSTENLKRIKALGGGISIQHRMAYQGENFVARYGILAAQNAPPLRAMLDLDIKVGAGTDGTRVASYNPWVAIYWLVTGKTVGGNDYWSKENKLDRTTALKLFTQGSASLIHQDKDRGTLKEGYLADMAILDTDFLTVDEEEIKTISSLLTIVDGKIVYGTGEYRSIAPAIPPANPAWSPVNYYGGYQYK